MKRFANIMGMPVVIEIVDDGAAEHDIYRVFDYFRFIDRIFSPYKRESEIEKINRGELVIEDASAEVRLILRLAEKTKKETNGYFSVYHKGRLDPSGLVKGYAIWQGAQMLQRIGYKNFFIEIAGDIQVFGNSLKLDGWNVGIRNPFIHDEVVKVVRLRDKGIATSGTYLRGAHIYNPNEDTLDEDVVSLTVIGPNIYEADRLATAAFAMGKNGISFVGSRYGFEGYMIMKDKIGVFTDGFEQYVL